jgi:hypothetical protein
VGSSPGLDAEMSVSIVHIAKLLDADRHHIAVRRGKENAYELHSFMSFDEYMQHLHSWLRKYLFTVNGRFIIGRY